MKSLWDLELPRLSLELIPTKKKLKHVGIEGEKYFWTICIRLILFPF